MTAMGHEDQFRLSKQSVCCRFGQETFAGMRGNGRDAPKAAVRFSENVCAAPGPNLG
jgi:hypothetical protein